MEPMVMIKKAYLLLVEKLPMLLKHKKRLGARVLLIKNNQILLIKHTYVNGWYTIGGGIDKSETPIAAAQRELYEEVGVILESPPKLFAVYHMSKKKLDDYIVLYVADNINFQQHKVTSLEIENSQWFSLDNLPKDTTPATRRRIDEYLGKREVNEYW